MPQPTLSSLSYDAEPPPDSDAIDHGVLKEFPGMYLRVACEAAYEDFARRLGDDALRPGYFTILTLIVNNPRITHTQIGIASQRDKSIVTKALRWMEDNGLIVRYLSARDRRTHMCVATDAGRKMQARMQKKAIGHLRALTDAIGADRHDAFIDTLKKLIVFLKRCEQK